MEKHSRRKRNTTEPSLYTRGKGSYFCDWFDTKIVHVGRTLNLIADDGRMKKQNRDFEFDVLVANPLLEEDIKLTCINPLSPCFVRSTIFFIEKGHRIKRIFSYLLSKFQTTLQNSDFGFYSKICFMQIIHHPHHQDWNWKLDSLQANYADC